MSIILQPTNHMLHAFRAGPMSTSGTTCTQSTTNECGGEELLLVQEPGREHERREAGGREHR